MTKNRAKHQQVVPPDLRAHCGRGYVPKRLLDCTLPPLFPGTTLAELELPARAQRFFERKRYVKRPTAVANLSVRDLAAVRGLGLTSIIDIVEALHRCAKLRGFKPKNFDFEEVSRPPEIAPRAFVQIPKHTVHLPAAMRNYRLPPLPPGTTLADLRLRGRALRFLEQSKLIERPEELAQLTLGALMAQGGIGIGTAADIVEAIYRHTDAPQKTATLDEEVLHWIAPKGKAERRKIVCHYYGLFGKPLRTSRMLGEAYGCSYQAIHQACRPITDAPPSLLRRFQDVIDAATSSLPNSATEVESRLAKQRLLKRGTRLEALLRISQLLKLDAPFVLRGKGHRQRALPVLSETQKRFQVFLSSLGQRLPVMQISRALAIWNDAGHAPLTSSSVEQIIASTERAHWLDQANGWFWLDCGGTSLRPRIQRSLAAAGELAILDLWIAVRRGPNKRDAPKLPLAVFRELCRQLPECQVDAETVSAASPKSAWQLLRGVERKLVEFLRVRGEPCHLRELREFVRSAGADEGMLWKLLHGSPAIQRCGRQRYAVVSSSRNDVSNDTFSSSDRDAGLGTSIESLRGRPEKASI